MAYTNNIPQAAQLISVSQPLIQANFQELDTYLAIDHVALNDADQGKHKKVTFTQQAGDPVTNVNEIALYTKAVSGVPQLYIRPQSSATAYQLSAGATPVVASAGSTWIPGGVIIKWGTFVPSGVSGSVNYPVAFPNTTFHVWIQQKTGNNATNPVNTSGNAASFSYNRLDTSVTYAFFAIGN